MSVGLVLFMSVMYLVLCFMFSKRSKHVITMMVVAPLDVFTMICDVFYDLPYYVFAAGRWCGVRVRRHGAFALLLTCMAVSAVAVWCWHVAKGACIGMYYGAKREEYVVTGSDVTVNHDGDDYDGGAGVLPKPLEDADRQKIYPLQLIAS